MGRAGGDSYSSSSSSFVLTCMLLFCMLDVGWDVLFVDSVSLMDGAT